MPYDNNDETMGMSYYEQRKGSERQYQEYLDSIAPMYYPYSGYVTRTISNTRYSATTMSADSQLTFYASGGANYHVRAFLVYSGAIGAPSGSGIQVIVSGNNSGTEFVGMYSVLSGSSFYTSGASTLFTFSSGTRVNYVTVEGFVLNGDTPPTGQRTGSVGISWGWMGGVANSASTMTLCRGSYLTYHMA